MSLGVKTWSLIPVLLVARLLFGQTDTSNDMKHGIVTGTVVENKSGAPLRKAVVIIRHEQEEGTGASTDALGKFTLRDIDPGTYQVTVERDGYVATRESERRVLVVKAGETNSDVKLTMLPTGVISGRVVDSDGDPILGASVQVAPLHKKKNDGSPGYVAATNDLGEYRASGIAPGEYKIAVSYERERGQRQVRMQRPAGADGRVVTDAYPVTYYPVTVNVTPRSETHGIDVQMIRTHAVRVRGHVTGLSGSMGVLTIQAIGGPATSLRTSMVKTAEGEFEFPEVLPGKYMLNAIGVMLGAENRLTASRTLDVGDTDLDDVQITVSPSQTIAGRFITPEGRKLPAGVIVALGCRTPGDNMQAGGFAQVLPDATFNIKNVSAGDYDLLIKSNAASDDLYIGSIRMGNTDALADGVHVEGSPELLEIVLKANGGTAACSVKDDQGSIVPGSHVVLVPDGARKRQFALYADCKADAEGTCKVTGTAPGDYHLYAFPGDAEVDFLRDPDFFKPFEDHGKSASFAEGQEQQVELLPVPSE